MNRRCNNAAVRLGIHIITLVLSAGLVGTVTTSVSGQRGQELVVAMGSEPVSLNPFVGGDFASHDVMRQIFDTLLTLDKDGKLVPMLAESFEPAGPTTWLVRLRRGVKFDNGEAFNAEAVQFTYNTILNPETQARGRSGIVGVANVEIVDEYTVKIHTEKPMPVLPWRNIYGGTGSVIIVPPRYFRKVGHRAYADRPIGTGAFKFVQGVKGQFIRLEANGEYWRGRPKVDTVTIRIVPEPSTRVAALLAGEADISIDLPVDLAPQVRTSPGTKLITGFFGRGNLYWQFNPIGPFADRRVRLAVLHAVNMNRILGSLFGEYAVRIGVPLHDGSFGLNKAIKPYPYDPAKARRLLQEAGYPNGFSTTFYTSNRYTFQKEMSEAMAADLAKVGIKVNITMAESARYLELMANRQAGPLFLILWGTLDLDADILVNMFHSQAAFATWKDPGVDKLLDAARTELDLKKREALYFQVEQRLYDQVAYLAGHREKWSMVVSSRVEWQPLLGRAVYFWNTTKN